MNEKLNVVSACVPKSTSNSVPSPAPYVITGVDATKYVWKLTIG